MCSAQIKVVKTWIYREFLTNSVGTRHELTWNPDTNLDKNNFRSLFRLLPTMPLFIYFIIYIFLFCSLLLLDLDTWERITQKA